MGPSLNLTEGLYEKRRSNTDNEKLTALSVFTSLFSVRSYKTNEAKKSMFSKWIKTTKCDKFTDNIVAYTEPLPKCLETVQ